MKVYTLYDLSRMQWVKEGVPTCDFSDIGFVNELEDATLFTSVDDALAIVPAARKAADPPPELYLHEYTLNLTRRSRCA